MTLATVAATGLIVEQVCCRASGRAKTRRKRSDKLTVYADFFFFFFQKWGDLAVAAEGGAIARSLVISSIVEARTE